MTGGLGAAYRRPVARLAEGLLIRQSGAHAMIDVSDGLSLDLHRLADASDVGFHLTHIPIAEGATLAEALGGGEDYELVMTMKAVDRAPAHRAIGPGRAGRSAAHRPDQR